MSEKNNKKEQAEVLENVNTAAGVVSSLTFGTIFGMLTFQSLTALAGLILFPINAASALFDIILAWRAAHVSDWKSGPVLRAGVETLTGAAIITAIVGSLVATTLFASITAPIFASVLAFKSLYHAGSAFYYLGKSVVADNLEKKVEYQMSAIDHAARAIASLVSVVAVVGVFMLAKATFGIAAVAVAGFGVATAIAGAFHRYFAKSAEKEKDKLVVEEKPGEDPRKKPVIPGSTRDMRAGLGATSVHKVSSSANVPAPNETREPLTSTNPIRIIHDDSNPEFQQQNKQSPRFGSGKFQ